MTTTLVIGGSQGLGRGVVQALRREGRAVVALARGEPALRELVADDPGCGIAVGDATDPEVVARVMSTVRPTALVLAAGAQPRMASLRDYDWESFAAPFHVDTKLTFHWLQACLTGAMPAGGRVVVFSSGAALHGSPLSGGYAPAKQAQRMLCDYARAEAQEVGVPLRIHCLVPQLNPNTELGARSIAAYAARAGQTPEEFVRRRFRPPLTPEVAGRSVAEILRGAHDEALELKLLGTGLAPV